MVPWNVAAGPGDGPTLGPSAGAESTGSCVGNCIRWARAGTQNASTSRAASILPGRRAVLTNEPLLEK